MSADIGQVSDAGPLLVVDNVSKKFGGVLALSAVSLEVNRGDIVGIIGPNGSGKTTLVNTITGFIKPDKGRLSSRAETSLVGVQAKSPTWV